MTAFKSTEGNGGPPIVLAKDPIEKPHVQRGMVSTVLMPNDVMHDGDIINGGLEEITFVTISECDRFRMHYHRAKVVSFDPSTKQIQAMVAPDTMVTWERLPG